MKQITPAEMIEWFRAKAEEFEGIARTLKATFNAEGKPSLEIQAVRQNGTAEVTVQSIKSALSGFPKGARFTKIAEALHADQEQVKGVMVSNPSDFEMKGRGWWIIKS